MNNFCCSNRNSLNSCYLLSSDTTMDIIIISRTIWASCAFLRLKVEIDERSSWAGKAFLGV